MRTSGAYPLLLYASFWYSHVHESNFNVSHRRPFAYIGSAIYLVALVPTLAAAAGGLMLLRRAWKGRATRAGAGSHPHTDLGSASLFVLLVATLAFLVGTVLQHHVRSIMQGRLLFPALAGFLVAFAVGSDGLRRRYPRAGRIFPMSTTVLLLLFCVYFGLERLTKSSPIWIRS